MLYVQSALSFTNVKRLITVEIAKLDTALSEFRIKLNPDGLLVMPNSKHIIFSFIFTVQDHWSTPTISLWLAWERE